MGIIDVFRDPTNPTLIFGGGLFCFFLQESCFSGTFDIVFVYEESFPICMSSSLMGYNQALLQGCLVFSWLFVKVASTKTSDYFLLVLGLVSNCCYYVLYGVSSVWWLLFVGTAVGCLGSIPTVVLRSFVSCLASPHQQGVVFALLGCAYSVSSIAGSAIFNGVYAATVGSFRGTVFFIAIAIEIVTLLLFSFFYRKASSSGILSKMNPYADLETEADA